MAILPDSNVKIQSLPLAKGVDNDLTLISVTDNDGYLWLASDSGLKRYDGYSLKTFTHEIGNNGSIGSTYIRAMTFQDDQLWLGGINLSLYHPESESFTTYEVSSGNAIWCIYKQGDIIWLGGGGFGLRGFNTVTKEVTVQALDTEQHRLVFDIKPDKNTNKLWIATGSGIYLYDPATNATEERLKLSDIGNDNQIIEEIVVDNNNYIWIATRQGLFKLNPKTNELTSYLANTPNAEQDNLLTNAYWSLTLDHDGHVWAGTDKYGVNIYNPDTDSFINIPSSLVSTRKDSFPAIAIFHIHQDQQGTYWFSTSEGIFNASPHLQRFHTIQNIPGEPNSLAFNNVLTLHQGKDGLIWIATDGGGLESYDPKTETFTHYVHDPNDPNSLSSNSVIAIDEDDNGNLWIGTYNGGLNKFDKKTQTFVSYLHDSDLPKSQTIINNDIFKIFVDEKQRIWMSIWREGIQIFDPATKRFSAHSPHGSEQNGHRNFLVVDIAKKAQDEYWIASYGGLEIFNLKTETYVKATLPDIARVLDVYPIDSHSAWLATDNGLVLYNDQSKAIAHYTQQDGLADNYIVSIELDNKGFIWLGTRKGLSRFDPKTKHFRNYSDSDGLVSSEFNRFSHLHANSGLMYFGGPRGINVFNPMSMPSNENIPNVVLSSFKVKNKANNESNLLPKWRQKEIITLPYDQNDVFFEFSALNFIAPHKNQYKYRLIGLEDQWNTADASDRNARYTNLSPGSYRFEIIASNNEGLWNTEGQQVNFMITPPWWLTWWAYLLFAFLLISFVYLFSYWRMRVNQQRALALEQEVEQRTKELKSAIVKLSQTQSQLVESEKMASLGDMVAGIAHEVNTPLGICLTSISHLKDRCDQLFKKFDSNTLAKNDFQAFKADAETGLSLSLSNISRATELIRSFKLVAVEQTSEQMNHFNLKKLLEDTVQTVSPTVKKAGAQITIDCEEQIEMLSYPGAITQIVINFVMNSLTHGLENKENGEITIIAEQHQGVIKLQYRDNGKGIPPSNHKKVFEPFFTTNRKKGNTGLGMHIVYNLVSQTLGGEIQINQPLQGVEFIIKIPINIRAC